MKTILISEDHTMFAMMLKAWLQQEQTSEILGVATTGAETIRLVRELKPNILIQDMMLSDMKGVDIIRQVRQEFREMAIFAVSGRANLVKLALGVGANGCMLKEDDPEVIRNILTWDTAKGLWVSPLMGGRLYRASQELLQYNFTASEMNVLQNISLTNSELGALLGLSEGTVRNTLTTIYQKIPISSRSELIRYVQDVLLFTMPHSMS